jgi:hypothetical protein
MKWIATNFIYEKLCVDIIYWEQKMLDSYEHVFEEICLSVKFKAAAIGSFPSTDKVIKSALETGKHAGMFADEIVMLV